MKQKLLLLTLGVLSALPALARDFEYSYKGQTIIYTVIDEDAKTCMTKAGGTTSDYISYAGNSIDGELILPSNPNDGDFDFTLTTIGELSFCKNGLTSVVIPNSVTEIGNDAFWDCSDLIWVVIGNSVTSIGDYAFGACGVEKSAYPNTLKAPIKTRISIRYNPEGSIIEDGWVWGPGKSAVYFAPPSLEGEYTLPESVTSIGDNAFSRCIGLTSIVIPNSVTEIGMAAFAGCGGLIKAEFSSIESLLKIKFQNGDSNPLAVAHHLYMDGNEVTDLEIPETMTSIGNYAFDGCSGLTSVVIPNSVTSIGNYAFYGCSGLTSVTIPQSVTELYCPFPSCENLKEIIVDDGNEYYVSDNGVLYNRDKTCVIQCPGGKSEYEFPNTVTKIGISAFYGCSGLTSMEISSSVTSIDLCAFFYCRGLTSVVIPSSVTELAWSAFYGCSSLTSVAIGCSITQIGPNTFKDCPISNLYITAQTPPIMNVNPLDDYSCKLWLQGESTLEKYRTANTWKDFTTTELMIEPTAMEIEGMTSFSGNPGDIFQATAKLTPADVTLPYVFWRSTNPKIATVDKNGLVTLQKYSAEDIKLVDGDEDNDGSCKIIAESIYFNGPIAEITVNNSGMSGVENITGHNGNTIDYSQHYDVYNMNGLKVGESTDGLSKGIYIIRQDKAAVKTVVR